MISLIHKEGPRDLIDNYRPINLLNVDLKIYTKILCSRMQPIMNNLLHETQYSQPGKNIEQLLTTVRDVQCDMYNSNVDSYFVSIDFKKAFDNIDHGYIERVLGRINFPDQFIKAFMSLYKNAGSKLIINGMRSKNIKIKSGIRQGDPFSKDIFTLSMNPLIVYLNRCVEIEKYKTISNQKLLTLAYVDDLNLMINWLTALKCALQKIDHFGKISGFKINRGKTKGIFHNKQQIVIPAEMPTIRWVQNIKVLGIHFGTQQYQNMQWNEKFLEFKKEIGFLKTRKPTLDAKSMLSKCKLCSIFSYIAKILPVPKELERKINDQMLGFVVPHKKTLLNANDFALSRQHGGYDFCNIMLFLELCLIKPAMQYVQEKVNCGSLSISMYFVEYNLGQKLCIHYGLERNNSTLHRFEPNDCYKNIFDILKKHKITLDEMMNGTLNTIYKRIIRDMGIRQWEGQDYYKLHKKIFPTYMKTFNYKVHFDLLPVKNKFNHFCLDSEEKVTCPFCDIHFESEFHLFSKCSKLIVLWQILDEAIAVCFANDCKFSFEKCRVRQCHYSLVSIKENGKYQDLILYLNSIVNYNLWKLRNQIVHEDERFDSLKLINKVIASICARKNIESRVKKCNKVPFIQEYHVTLASVRDAMFDPG